MLEIGDPCFEQGSVLLLECADLGCGILTAVRLCP